MAVAVARARSVSAPTYLRLATASGVALFLVITSGAFVRLTGSGLGCENWPSCGDKPYPEQGFHAFVEFGNRMVALVGHRPHAPHVARVAARARAVARRTVGRARRVPRRRRTDPDGRNHDRARSAPARGHDALPARAHGVRARGDRRVRGVEPQGRPGTGSRPRLAPLDRDRAGASGVHRPARDRSRCDGVGAAPWLERRRRAARARHRGHRLRARPRCGGVRHRRSRRGLASSGGSVSGTRGCFASGSAFSSCSSVRRSWARCSTGTRFRGVSSSFT